MNVTEIVKHILEGDHEEFDPLDYVKSARNRESAVEIYNGPLVRVIQPLAAFTINNYLPDGSAWDDSYYQSIEKGGPIYLAVDKADHDNMVIFQPSTNNAWNNDGRQVDFKELPALISSDKPTSKWETSKNPAEDKNWLDLQQGLATFFMAQIAKKKNVGQWVKFLTMIGRTDLATNYARHLGRAKLPFGKSIDAVMAMKKAGKRSRNRIARLMKNQSDVKWGEQGFWLLFNDWEDLAPFYSDGGRNQDYQKNAEKIFGGDCREWFEFSDTKPEDVWSDINDKNLSIIKQLLVNRTVYNSDGEEHLVTRDNIEELTDDEIKDIVCDRGNKGDGCEDIYDAIRFAADDAYASSQENAYYEGYRNALMKQWGLQEDKTIKWIKVGKKAKDSGDQKTMLGIWFPYSTLEEWIKRWKEDEYEDDYYGDIHDLAKAYLEPVEPMDEYSGDNDSDYFNEQLDYHLSELELTPAPKQEDPNQPELPLEGELKAEGGEIERPYTVHVGNPPNENVYKGIPKSEATKYREAMKPQRDDITFRAESFLAIPFDRLEEAASDVTITFKASDEAAESVVPLLKELKKMGSQGSSRNIKIEDWDGRDSFGFDGDGASKIGEITVDGQVVAESLLQEAIYKYSTTQIDLPKEIGGHIIQWGELNIADEDLYIDEKDGCGRETEQHVTVLYGLTDQTPPEALTHIVQSTKPFLIEFGGVSIFENPKYDVIKLDVISEELHNLHLELRRSCPNENKFPDYKPHCTIAYVQKGKGKKYAGQDVFKTANVPRDFWAYDLKFKGAGDSEDGERVVDLISFDKSKDFEPDEPEAGEQRYPQATREEEPAEEMAMAESIDAKAFLAQHVPTACPGCKSHNLTEPDDEGLVDCLECGIWFDPLHPENKPVAESDEVDPKQFTERPGSVDPHPEWNVIDRTEDKNGRVKVLYRHKYGRVFFKLINEFFGDDTPPTPLTDWSVYVYGGADGKDFMDGEDFKAGSFDEAETTATNIAFTLTHSTAPSLFQPARPRRGRQQESDELDTKSIIARVPHHELLHWNEAGPEGGYKCSCGQWRYKLTGWSTSIGYAMKEFRAHKRLAKQKEKLGEAEELNAKEFLNRTTNYRIRMGVGAQTKYLHQDVGTGALKWHDFDGASIFDSDKAGEMIDRIGEVYGGQPVVAELAESDQADPKEMAMRVPTDYVIKRFGDPQDASRVSYWAGEGMLFYRNINDARIMSEAEANATYKRMVQANYSPNELQVVGVKRGYQRGKMAFTESMPGPFEDDGLPGEVTSFLRKVRSKRSKKPKQPII